MENKNACPVSLMSKTANSLIFLFFAIYSVYFLLTKGFILNGYFMHETHLGLSLKSEVWAIISYFAIISYIIWVSIYYFFSDFNRDKPLLLIFLTAVIIRLVPAALTFGAAIDMADYELIQRSVISGNWKWFMFEAPYFPFFSYLLYILGILNNVLKLPEYFVIKLAPVLFDSIMIFAVYLITDRKKAAAYAWNPITIMVSACQGQFDSITLFFVLLSIYYMRGEKSPAVSGIFLGTAFQSKWWPLMFTPAYIFRLKLKKTIIFALSWAAVFLLFSGFYLRDPSLLLNPLKNNGLPGYLGLSGVLDFFIIKVLNLNNGILNLAFIILKVVCFLAILSAAFFSRKWEISLPFFSFCLHSIS